MWISIKNDILTSTSGHQRLWSPSSVHNSHSSYISQSKPLKRQTTKHADSSQFPQDTESGALSGAGQSIYLPGTFPQWLLCTPESGAFHPVRQNLSSDLPFSLPRAVSTAAPSVTVTWSVCLLRCLEEGSLRRGFSHSKIHPNLLNLLLLWSFSVQPHIPNDVKRHWDELPFFIFHIHIYLNVNQEHETNWNHQIQTWDSIRQSGAWEKISTRKRISLGFLLFEACFFFFNIKL